jgi:hypothetical protein
MTSRTLDIHVGGLNSTLFSMNSKLEKLEEVKEKSELKIEA